MGVEMVRDALVLFWIWLIVEAGMETWASTFTLTAGGETVEQIPGGLTLTVPVEDAGPGTVAMLIHEDGTREVIQQSIVEDEHHDELLPRNTVVGAELTVPIAAHDAVLHGPGDAVRIPGSVADVAVRAHYRLFRLALQTVKHGGQHGAAHGLVRAEVPAPWRC